MSWLLMMGGKDKIWPSVSHSKGKQRLIGHNGAVLDAFGMNRQDILKGQFFGKSKGRESGFSGFHQAIGHGELDTGKAIQPHRYGFSFMPVQIGKLLLHLNELRQAFLGDGVPCGRASRHVRSNPFESLGHQNAPFGPGLGVKKRIGKRRAL